MYKLNTASITGIYFWNDAEDTESLAVVGGALAHDLVDPGNELLDVGVDAGQVLATAADAPGDEADQHVPALHGHCQRAARIPLWERKPYTIS